MRRGIRLPALGVAAAAAFGAAARAQDLARIPPPSPGQWVAELESGAVPKPTYVDASGRADELPYALDLYHARLALSRSLSQRVSPGLFVMYRENRYCCAGGATIMNRGVSGYGAFLDVRPGAGASPLLRLEYEHAARGDGSLLPVSDGQDRVRLLSDWGLLAGRGSFAGVEGRLGLEAGFGRAQLKSYGRAGGELASGFDLVRTDGLKLLAAGTLGYVWATDDRENGTIFHNRRSTRASAGAEISLGFGRGLRNRILLEARHDFAARNTLSGWRLGLTLRRTFGASGKPAGSNASGPGAL